VRPKCEECGQRFEKPRSEVREIRAASYRSLTCPACNERKIAANQVILERDQRKQRSHTNDVEYWLERAPYWYPHYLDAELQRVGAGAAWIETHPLDEMTASLGRIEYINWPDPGEYDQYAFVEVRFTDRGAGLPDEYMSVLRRELRDFRMDKNRPRVEHATGTIYREITGAIVVLWVNEHTQP
jgi:hypothetical protein